MVDLIALAYGVDNDKVLSEAELARFRPFRHSGHGSGQRETGGCEDDAAGAAGLSASASKVHEDKKEFPTFALTMGKKSQMKEADGSGETGCQFQVQGLPKNGGRGGGDAPPQGAPVLSFTCHNMTMPALAEYMHTMPLSEQFLGTNPLVDETGLAAAWNLDFHFELPNGPNSSSGAAMADLFEKQTGLKIEARKVALPVVIVDSASEKPTPNLPGVVEKLPVSPTEFEVADIKPERSERFPGPGRGGGFQPGGRLDLRGIPLEAADCDCVGRLRRPGWFSAGRNLSIRICTILLRRLRQRIYRAGTTSQTGRQPPLDVDALRLMLRALIIDRFKLTTHMEDKPLDAYTLLADKPKNEEKPIPRTGRTGRKVRNGRIARIRGKRLRRWGVW